MGEFTRENIAKTTVLYLFKLILPLGSIWGKEFKTKLHCFDVQTVCKLFRHRFVKFSVM